jgi:hypothetical protein
MSLETTRLGLRSASFYLLTISGQSLKGAVRHERRDKTHWMRMPRTVKGLVVGASGALWLNERAHLDIEIAIV